MIIVLYYAEPLWSLTLSGKKADPPSPSDATSVFLPFLSLKERDTAGAEQNEFDLYRGQKPLQHLGSREKTCFF